MHRLAVAGREAGIARDVGGRVGGGWLARSRFADVARLAELTLTLGEDARAFYQLGWARNATGEPDRGAGRLRSGTAPVPGRRRPRQRGRHAEQHRRRVPRSGRAAAGAGVLRAGAADHAGGRGPGRGGGHAEQHRRRVRGLGEPQRALEYYGQALPILREVGDRAGEAATLNNIGAVYAVWASRSGRWSTTGRRCRSAGGRGPGRGGGHAEQHRRACTRSGRAAAGAGVLRAGAADHAGGRGPGRGGGHAEQHRRRVRGLGEPQRALEYYGQALPIRREVGDRAGEAATLNNIGAVYDGLGEPQRALEYYGQALPILREVGDRAGEAVTRYNMAMIHRAQGELGRAVAELEQVVELDRQVSHPDLQSDTEMLHRVRQELASPDPGRGSR